MGDLQIAPTIERKTLMPISMINDQSSMINDLCSLFTFHFSLFTTYPSSFAWLHSSLFTPSRVNIGRFANRPYERTKKPSCQYGIITFHSSLLTPSRVNIGRFANRPYDRTQKPSCQYGIITFSLFTLHFSLLHSPTCLHRAICKSPLQQNAKALMLIWDNHFLPHTQAHSLGYTFHFSLFTLHSPHSSSSSLEKKSSRSRRSFLVGRPSPFLR